MGMRIASARPCVGEAEGVPRKAASVGGSREESALLSRVLTMSRDAGAVLQHLTGGMFCLPDGRTVAIKTALVRDGDREHHSGHHRFKIVPSVSTHAFLVFAVQAAKTIEVVPRGPAPRRPRKLETEPAVYVFRPKSVAHLKSLALRFAFMERPSMYSFALNRWNLMTKR